MDKYIFNQVANAIRVTVNLRANQHFVTFNEFCVNCLGITVPEYEEFFELALIGFKEKYKQHNHEENNKE